MNQQNTMLETLRRIATLASCAPNDDPDAAERELTKIMNLAQKAIREVTGEPAPIFVNDATVCRLKNPWSEAIQEMTWAEIKQWAHEHIYPTDRPSWLRAARAAAKRGDEKTLGNMIIGC